MSDDLANRTELSLAVRAYAQRAPSVKAGALFESVAVRCNDARGFNEQISDRDYSEDSGRVPDHDVSATVHAVHVTGISAASWHFLSRRPNLPQRLRIVGHVGQDDQDVH